MTLPSLLPNQGDTGLSTAKFSKESLDTAKGDGEDNSLIVYDFFFKSNQCDSASYRDCRWGLQQSLWAPVIIREEKQDFPWCESSDLCQTST